MLMAKKKNTPTARQKKGRYNEVKIYNSNTTGNHN